MDIFKVIITSFSVIIIMVPNLVFSSEKHNKDYVVLLHGLGRTAQSFARMESYLKQCGYIVVNIDYPSRKFTIETLCINYIKPVIDQECHDEEKTINFITHSMGGIIVRYYLKTYPMKNIGRVLMIAPPNHGSEVVDYLRKFSLIARFMGPAFLQLGTADDSFVNRLGPPSFKFGVIAGDKSINWINSMIIPGKDDGKVSVKSTKMTSMEEFQVINRTHPFILGAKEVIVAADRYLKSGKFKYD